MKHTNTLIALSLLMLISTGCNSTQTKSSHTSQTLNTQILTDLQTNAPIPSVPIKKIPDFKYKIMNITTGVKAPTYLKFQHCYVPENPPANQPMPAIIFFFGGGWTGGTPAQMDEYCKFFASAGFFAVSAQYRTSKTYHTTPFECVKDARTAVRLLRRSACDLNIDPDRIIAAGGSAGGHVAASAAIFDDLNESTDDLTASAIPNALILLNPVLDTTKKGYGSNKFTPENQTALSPVHHIEPNLPPTIIFHGTKDTTVPFENATRFTDLMNDAKNICILIPFEKKGHGFFNHTSFRKNNDPADFTKTAKLSYYFLKHLALTPQE